MYVLTFEEFDVEAGDSLTVFDGRSSAAPLLGRFSGAELPPTLTSTGPNLYLEFASNDNVKRPAKDLQSMLRNSVLSSTI